MIDWPGSTVLLHSLGLGPQVWDGVLAELAQPSSVLRPVTEGHAGVPISEPASLEKWSRDILRALDETGIERAAVVGLSLGGLQAAHFAATHPDRVSAVVISDSFARLDAGAMETRISSIARDVAEMGMPAYARHYLDSTFQAPVSAETYSALEALIAGFDEKSYLDVSRACFSADVTDCLRSLRAPVKVIVGDLDQKTPIDHARFIAEQSDAGEVSVIPGAGHLAPIEKPREFADIVAGFLASLTEGDDAPSPAGQPARFLHDH